jgi:hypothetical protein
MEGAQDAPLVAVMPPVHEPALPAEEREPPQLDGAEDEELDVDQDDAQSVMQPAISPLATLLTSPRMPAAEKVAAINRQSPGEPFETSESDEPSQENAEMLIPGYGRQVPENSQDGLSPVVRLPTPWQAGPKQFLVSEPGRFRSSMAAAFQTRQQRSQSVGESLKRLSKALPSISIPSGFLPSITTPTFFSSSSSPPKDARGSHAHMPSTLLTPETSSSSSRLPDVAPPHAAPIQPDSARPRTLRHTASDDSLLYQALSRVSSLGDDERFTHVRAQVNVRFKAIKDSFDGPSFKLPQMPSRLSRCMLSSMGPWTDHVRSA